MRRARALTGDGDEGMGHRGRCLLPSTPGSPLLLARAAGLPSAALGGDGAPAAQPPTAPGEVRVPPRQERGVRGLQVPRPHPGVRRAGHLSRSSPFSYRIGTKTSAGPAAAVIFLMS